MFLETYESFPHFFLPGDCESLRNHKVIGNRNVFLDEMDPLVMDFPNTIKIYTVSLQLSFLVDRLLMVLILKRNVQVKF